jgi:RHS repeat-associated protein
MSAVMGKNNRSLPMLLGSLLLAVQMPAYAGVEYIHTDSLGTPVAITDSDGNAIQTSEYEPYGKLLNRPLTDAPGYTGHETDATTAMVYMQQRYYDPQIGRFLSIDPVSVSWQAGGNFNRYKYAANNPYRFSDPDGRYECEGASCGQVKAGLTALRSSLNGSISKTGSDHAALSKVLGFYGKEGVANGVKISTGPTNAGGPMGSSTHNGVTNIKIDAKLMNGLAALHKLPITSAYAAELAHEGQHGIDQRHDGMPNSRAEELRGETRAARTEAAGWQAVNTDSWWKTWTQAGGFDSKAIQKEAEAATTAWCQGNSACK